MTWDFTVTAILWRYRVESHSAFQRARDLLTTAIKCAGATPKGRSDCARS